ncbi:MAG: hypothetical protein OQK73_06205 [Gammaproteobacteria bacterium]|nr:hypothetical protein [Gammaproteobacteria bacterium]
MTSTKPHHCVELLCANGCQSVRDYIRRLENGEPVPHTETLNEDEKQTVLSELKAIMAVYDNNNS